MKNQEKNSGSELLEVESDWKKSSGEAETEAVDLINDLIDDTKDELESEGKEVISTYNYPIITEEKVENGETLHKALTKAEINWIYEKANFTYLKENFVVTTSGIDNNYLIVEDELLKRFRKKFNGRYDRIGLSNLDFIDSDISVDFSDYIELPKSIEVNTTRTKNCSAKEDIKNLEITIQEKFTEQISLVKKITTKTEVGFNVGIKSKDVGEIGLSIKKNWDMDITKSTSDEFQKTETKKETFEYTTPPWSILTVDAINGIKARKYKLNGTALFDATINLNYKTRHCKRVNIGIKVSWDCKTKWHPYAVKLSDVLSIEERLINLDGYLFTTDSKFQERIINVEPANDCFKTDDADLPNFNSDNLPQELQKIRDRLIIYPPYTEEKQFEEGKILRSGIN